MVVPIEFPKKKIVLVIYDQGSNVVDYRIGPEPTDDAKRMAPEYFAPVTQTQPEGYYYRIIVTDVVEGVPQIPQLLTMVQGYTPPSPAGGHGAGEGGRQKYAPFNNARPPITQPFDQYYRSDTINAPKPSLARPKYGEQYFYPQQSYLPPESAEEFLARTSRQKTDQVQSPLIPTQPSMTQGETTDEMAEKIAAEAEREAAEAAEAQEEEEALPTDEEIMEESQQIPEQEPMPAVPSITPLPIPPAPPPAAPPPTPTQTPTKDTDAGLKPLPEELRKVYVDRAEVARVRARMRDTTMMPGIGPGIGPTMLSMTTPTKTTDTGTRTITLLKMKGAEILTANGWKVIGYIGKAVDMPTCFPPQFPVEVDQQNKDTKAYDMSNVQPEDVIWPDPRYQWEYPYVPADAQAYSGEGGLVPLPMLQQQRVRDAHPSNPDRAIEIATEIYNFNLEIERGGDRQALQTKIKALQDEMDSWAVSA